MSVFVDTSAIYALLVADDGRHEQAKTILTSLRHENAALVSTSFVVHESVALLQSRIGIGAARTFHQYVFPALNVDWIDAARYERAMVALLAANTRHLSLTDWISFDTMRGRGIERVFAFDTHFTEQGFRLE